MIITEISTNKYTESINSWFVTKNHKDVLFFIQKNIDMKLSKMYFSNGNFQAISKLDFEIAT